MLGKLNKIAALKTALLAEIRETSVQLLRKSNPDLNILTAFPSALKALFSVNAGWINV